MSIRTAHLCLLVCLSAATALAQQHRLGGGTYTNTGSGTCANSTVVPVPVGPIGNPSTVTIFGDNTPASGPTGCPAHIAPGPVWWESFEITSLAKVTIDLCGTTPVQDPSYTMLLYACPSGGICQEPRNAFTSDRGEPYCADNNIGMIFRNVMPGIYHYPVRSNVARGPYVMHVHAEAAPPVDGPDLITGLINQVEQLGREGALGSGIVGLGVETGMCNLGDEAIPIAALPAVDHQLIFANMFRSKIVNDTERFEQIGRSWVKHTFGSSNFDYCSLGCEGGPNDELSPYCGDIYHAGQMLPCDMGPRSMVHPFTGIMLSGASLGSAGGCFENYPSSNHTGHDHPGFPYAGVDHRLQVRDADLAPELNVGATYLIEAGYINTTEYIEVNGRQNNNLSHRQYLVNGPDVDGLFLFAEMGDTMAESPALDAWQGAQQAVIEPYPLQDGLAILACEVTAMGDGLWHYEYLLYNINMDASMWRFEILLPHGVVVSDIGFHMPPAHAPMADDGGYSSVPWTASLDSDSITWSTDDFATDPLANAIRWGTGYNFRFDANGPPGPVTATIGLFKTAGSAQANIAGPAAPIPAASGWSVVIAGLLLAIAGGVLVRQISQASIR